MSKCARCGKDFTEKFPHRVRLGINTYFPDDGEYKELTTFDLCSQCYTNFFKWLHLKGDNEMK